MCVRKPLCDWIAAEIVSFIVQDSNMVLFCLYSVVCTDEAVKEILLVCSFSATTCAVNGCCWEEIESQLYLFVLPPNEFLAACRFPLCVFSFWSSAKRERRCSEQELYYSDYSIQWQAMLLPANTCWTAATVPFHNLPATSSSRIELSFTVWNVMVF